MPSFTDKLQVGGHEMEMYASIPSGSGPHPAVVIAFHVGGVDEFDKAMADRLAAEGYAAVVPDLFHRLSAEVMDGPRLGRLSSSRCRLTCRRNSPRSSGTGPTPICHPSAPARRR